MFRKIVVVNNSKMRAKVQKNPHSAKSTDIFLTNKSGFYATSGMREGYLSPCTARAFTLLGVMLSYISFLHQITTLRQ